MATTMHVLSIDKQSAYGFELGDLFDMMYDELMDKANGPVIWHRIDEFPDHWKVLMIAS